MENFIPPSTPADRQAWIDYLCTANPDELLGASQQLALAAFQRAAARVPAYATILRQAGVDPAAVRTIGDFHRLVPLTDKHNTFRTFSMPELCLDGNLDGMRSALTSSGHSGIFAFGINTAENIKNSARSIDLGLQYAFNVDQKKTLLINCLPMGVKVHTNAVTLVETSVRDDMALAVAQKISPAFDQTVIVAEGSFAKKILEDGRDQGIDWAALHTSLITGEEGIAENWRTYAASLLGRDPDAQGTAILSSMGIAECDLNLFHETPETIRLRRLAHRDRRLRQALFGDDVTVCPMFFIYYPHRTYVEIVGNQPQGELLLTMLSPEMKVPLIRYNPKDIGRMFTRDQVAETLRGCGYSTDLLPEWRLPMLAIYGRGQHVVAHGAKIFPEEIKETLYHDFAVARSITGNFKLRADNHARAVAEIQLKPGVAPSPDFAQRFAAALPNYLVTSVDAQFLPYATFRHAMSVDWERKFAYIGSTT